MLKMALFANLYILSYSANFFFERIIQQTIGYASCTRILLEICNMLLNSLPIG